MKSTRPKYTLGDTLRPSGGMSFKVYQMSMDEAGNIFYKEGSFGPWYIERMLTLIKSTVLEEVTKEEEVANEASFDQQKYLSRLDKTSDISEVVTYFGAATLLNEIGVDDCIDHFSEEVILREIGEITAINFFKPPS